jgi:menaquinone-specific isochorismate synthase
VTLTSDRYREGSNDGTGEAARGDQGAGTFPAPGAFLASSFQIDPEDLPDLVRAGGAPGSLLLWRNDLCMLGVGQAFRISLPAPWANQAALVGRALRGIRQAGATDEVHDGPAGYPSDLPVPPGETAPAGTFPTGLFPTGPFPTGPFPAGPAAMGVLPYDPSSSGYLVVPELLIARKGACAWATLVSPAQEPAPRQADVLQRVRRLRDATSQSGPPPDGFTLTAHMPHQQWMSLVERTLGEFTNGNMAKVVLARRVDVVANRPFVLHDALARLASLYPSCAVFRVADFIGASPEILVRRAGTQVLSHPLAGTAARSGEQATDEAVVSGLMTSPKHRREHRLVVEAIAERLAPMCAVLDVPGEPSVLALRNVSHLGTPIRGTLLGAPPKTHPLAEHATTSDADGPASGQAPSARPNAAGPNPARPNPASRGDLEGTGAPSALELAALLQPTPAVGGHPTEAAIAWQRANEGFDRGWYAGPVGWVDARGDGEWVLGLRSAKVNGQNASLYAGNGIVAGSDPQAELAETQLKLQALLAALVRP